MERTCPYRPGLKVIDVARRYVLPGLIDSHTHIALDMNDVNEATDPVTPQLWMKDIIGAVNSVIKLKYARPIEELLVKNVRPQL